MPSFDIEAGCVGPVAGVDEVGRGPLAGPVVACAVVLNSSEINPDLFNAIRDSKAISAGRRAVLARALEKSKGVCFCLGRAEVEEIDTINILEATFLAMRRALGGLSICPQTVLVDGPHKIRRYEGTCKPVVKGDSLSVSIAAASIIAKVARDQEMVALCADYPGYGWESNAGYGTKAHLEAIHTLGVTPHHRRSFKPVRLALEREAQGIGSASR